jgi:hypothetical protein
MVNYREVVRRLIKYLLMATLVSMSLLNMKKNNIMEALYIGFIAATLFAVLDMVSPTICIKHNEK